ncbi:hypothetical protein HF325_002070 [Metschnikowia pulcherrima]|uniref:Uncharacterized protein n=1 Tax=Metschnikowia pulcherrima TaxID=27326 RepID=A0A8H7GSB1_9ASCO|nr:hypothetical protein HF325_002070 [Metschnikowia pulcherrima]
MSRRARETATAVSTTSADPTSSVELDVTKNMVEPFRMFSFLLKSYVELENSNMQFQFNAAHIVLQQVIEPFKYSDYVPYRLELDKSNCFPEFYFRFKRAFSRLSDEHKAYCLFDRDKFQSCYIGTENEILSAVLKVESEFKKKFKHCLDPAFEQLYPTLSFDRKCVETEFKEILEKDINYLPRFARLQELSAKAHKGDFLPYMEYLMAYEYPEEMIWSQFVTIYYAHISNDKQTLFLEKKIKHWMSVKTPIQLQMKGFVKDLKAEGIIKELVTSTKGTDKNTLKSAQSVVNAKDQGGKESSIASVNTQKQGNPPGKKRKFTAAQTKAYYQRLQRRTNSQNENQSSTAGSSTGSEKKDGDSDGSNKRRKFGTMQIPVSPSSFNTNLTEYSRVVFKWDGGAALHAVNDKSLLSNFDPDATCSYAAAKTLHEIKGAGDIKIRFKDNTTVVLKQVFYDKDLFSNVISTTLCNPFFTGVVGNDLVRLDNGFVLGHIVDGAPEVEVEIIKDDSPITTTAEGGPSTFSEQLNELSQDSADEEIEDEEFAVAVQESPVGTSLIVNPSEVSVEWHGKLGHPGEKAFDQFKKDLHLTGVKHVPLTKCDACLAAKLKNVYPKTLQSLDPITRPFEVLHCDLCGPFKHTMALDNSMYFLTVVDRVSRVTHAVPIRYKSTGTTELLKFILETYTSFGSKAF